MDNRRVTWEEKESDKVQESSTFFTAKYGGDRKGIPKTKKVKKNGQFEDRERGGVKKVKRGLKRQVHAPEHAVNSD